jgi:hypothetical protein
MMARNSIKDASPVRQGAGSPSLLLALAAACVASAGIGAQQIQEKKDAPVAAKQEQQRKIDVARRAAAAKKAEAANKAREAAIRRQQVIVQNQWTDEQFDQMVFQQDRNADGARRRLEPMLVLHLESIDRSCKLTDAQRKKLQLAGRGDIKRFFDHYEAAKQKLQLVKDDQQKLQEIWQDISPLQMTLSSGLFEADSLFYKSLHNTLTSGQCARYDAVERERREFNHRASIEQAVSAWEQAVPLRDAQRQELIKLLTKQAKAPHRSAGPYGSSLVAFHLSQLPEEKLRRLFDGTQWKIMNWYRAQGKQLGPFLRQSGLLDEEADRADAQPVPAKK